MREILGEALEFELGNGTVVIVPTEESPVSSVNGKIGHVELDWRDVQVQNLLDDTPMVWSAGGLYADTGIEFTNDTTARTGFVPVLPGGVYVITKDSSMPVSSIFEFAANSVTTSTNNPSLNRISFTEPVVLFTAGENTHYIRFRVNAPVDTARGNVHLLSKGYAVPHGRRTYAAMSEMLRDNSLVPGVRVETLGFDAEGDFGGGIYEIVSDTAANNCTIFELQNGFFAQRVFTGDPVYLESLNVKNVSFSTIKTALSAAKVRNVRCSDLTLDKTVEIGAWDFEFDTLTYTGTGYAITLNSISHRFIRGNRISAANGSGILVTDATARVLRNTIDVRALEVKDTGILIKPAGGKGIMHNTYKIGWIESKRRGFETYISADTEKYSWQGEEYIAIGNIQCQSGNTDRPAVAVSLVVEPHPDSAAEGSQAYSKAGTITGLTFAHLGVENSDIGVQIKSAPSGATPGGASPVDGQEPGIKSIIINDMRCREQNGTNLFLDAYGYLKDIYIRPTSPVQLCQWQITNTARDVGCFIDAPVYEHNAFTMIGSGIRSIRGITYVAEGSYHPLTITGDTDFTVMGLRPDDPGYVKNSGLFIAKYFELDPSRTGQITTVNMAYYYKESASDLMFKLPAAAIGPENATMTTALKLTFDDINDGGRGTPAPYTVTLLNRDTQADHLYSVSVMTKFSDMKDIAVVRDLGPVS